MKNFIITFFTHKKLYLIAISFGTITSTISTLITNFSTKQLFGISAFLWVWAFIINIIDIHTGIKADTKRKNDIGESFKFESNKGWRAIEKIFVFTVIMALLYHTELEFIRLNFSSWLCTALLYLKLIFFFYVILIEIQSIGENEEVRYGKKGKVFRLLDSIIDIVNNGIIKRTESIFDKKD